VKVRLNGSEYTVADEIVTIEQLLEHLQLHKRVVIVEHNRKVLRKEDHETAYIADGDMIEIVHFVGGG
jgi:sulfur carrier protein